MPKVELKELLSQARENKKWSIDRLAKEACVSNNSLLLIERGDWPEKQKTLVNKSTGNGKKALAAWVNIITCAAYVLGELPKRWVDVAGLPCNSQAIEKFILALNTRKSNGEKNEASAPVVGLPFSSLPPDYSLTVADLDLLRDIVQKVGGAMRLKTALDILRCSKANAQPSA